MTSCVHKMCERTYGQTSMKRAITLTKINNPEIGIICACSDNGQSRYQILIKIQQKTNDWLRTQSLGTDEWTDKGIPVYPPLCELGYN